jgi:hypothetical protein
MDTQHFTSETQLCLCGARLGAGHPTMCRKCVSRSRWTRRHLARGGHGGVDKAIRSRRRRNRTEDGGDA